MEIDPHVEKYTWKKKLNTSSLYQPIKINEILNVYEPTNGRKYICITLKIQCTSINLDFYHLFNFNVSVKYDKIPHKNLIHTLPSMMKGAIKKKPSFSITGG